MSESAAISLRDLKAMMQAEVMTLAAELAPGGKREGGYWIAPNPSRDGDRPGSFKIWLAGPSRGCWREYDGGEDEAGDIIDLPIYARVCRDRADVKKWALARYGLTDASPEKREKAAARAKAANDARDRDEARQRERKIESAREIFGRGHTLTPATWGWRYYRDARGIGVDRLAEIAAAQGRAAPFPDIRFIGQLRYSGPEGTRTFPALVAAMRDTSGEIMAAHRTWLHPETGDKAPVGKAKKMLGAAKGCAIRVWTPPFETPPAAAPQGEGRVLILTEGIEDALCCAVAKPDAICWATGSLDGLLSFEAPPDLHGQFGRIIVFADNDWTGGPAAKAFEAAMRRLRAVGKSVNAGWQVSEARAPVGKDANDFLQRGGVSHGTG